MKIITFSTKFPAKHPRAGEPTFFPEKIMACLADVVPDWKMRDDFVSYDWHQYYNAKRKSHTIRAGNRHKVGDWFSARIWGDDINPKSGRSGPYQSKQLEFAKIQIKKIWDIKIEGYFIWINGELFSQFQFSNQVANLARNDGLETQDFWDWFPCKPGKIFTGQIICFNEAIEY